MLQTLGQPIPHAVLVYVMASSIEHFDERTQARRRLRGGVVGMDRQSREIAGAKIVRMNLPPAPQAGLRRQNCPALNPTALSRRNSAADNAELLRSINKCAQRALLRAGHFQRYGRSFPTDGSNIIGTLNYPRTFLPGMPFAAYLGIKMKS